MADERTKSKGEEKDGRHTLLDCSLLRFVTNEILKLQLVFIRQLLDVWEGDGRAGEGIHGRLRGDQKKVQDEDSTQQIIDFDE